MSSFDGSRGVVLAWRVTSTLGYRVAPSQRRSSRWNNLRRPHSFFAKPSFSAV